MLRWETHLHQLRDYILLFFLLSISLIVMNSNSNSQMRWLHGFSINVVSGLRYNLHVWGKIRRLEKENEMLRSRIAQLAFENNMMKEAYLSNIRLKKLLKYKRTTSYRLIPAIVTGQNYEGFSHALLISAGKKQNLQEKLPVVTAEGLVGKIALLGANYAVVQPLDDVNFRVSAMVQRSRVVGIFSPGKMGRYALDYVPNQADVKKGDVIITSGYSDIFPKGIKIGVVARVESKKGALFKKVEVIPSVRTGNVEDVFVILKKAQ